MLGAIQLAVVANKFNLPLNKTGIYALEGSIWIFFLVWPGNFNLNTRSASPRQKDKKTAKQKHLNRKKLAEK